MFDPTAAVIQGLLQVRAHLSFRTTSHELCELFPVIRILGLRFLFEAHRSPFVSV